MELALAGRRKMRFYSRSRSWNVCDTRGTWEVRRVSAENSSLINLAILYCQPYAAILD